MDERLKKLRSQGTILKPRFIIGKNGLTETVIKNIKDELKKSSLIKIKFLATFVEDKDKKKIVKELLEKTGTELVQFIGFTVVITRKQ